MPEYLSPGVYIEEIPSGSKPIEGVSTSTAGFLGMAERGPEWPKFITSWLEYQRWFGGYPDEGTPGDSYLPYAVQGFFDNGGKRCFVGRVVAAATPVALSTRLGDLLISAIGRGGWGSRIFVRVTAATKPPRDGTAAFRVTLLYYKTMPPLPLVNPLDPANNANANRRVPDVVEDYDNLTAVAGSSTNAASLINAASHLVRVAWMNIAPAAAVPPPPGILNAFAPLVDAPPIDVRPIAGDFNGGIGENLPQALFPDEPLGRGLLAFESIDEISLLVAPDQAEAEFSDLTTALVNHCENLRDRFTILALGPNAPIAPETQPPQDSTFGAVYYPWMSVYDPSRNTSVMIPPTGHVAGIYARTDVDRGVHKAPANEVVRGAQNLEVPVPKGVQDLLNPRGINCLRDFRTAGRGIRVWGARTMSSDPEWRYINVRRLFLFVEESVEESTQWVVFEPNDDTLWAKVRRNLTNFLVRVWRSGALLGLTEAEAFFVRCDRTTMTQDDLDNGRLVCYVGIAPVKPAEFVIFRFTQKTLDAPQ